jgi:hypothetical protein
LKSISKFYFIDSFENFGKKGFHLIYFEMEILDLIRISRVMVMVATLYVHIKVQNNRFWTLPSGRGWKV